MLVLNRMVDDILQVAERRSPLTGRKGLLTRGRRRSAAAATPDRRAENPEVVRVRPLVRLRRDGDVLGSDRRDAMIVKVCG
jgi:hypothetical protein